MQYVKFERISLNNHPEFNERWVQERIKEDPGLLGLGDVIVKDIERLQPRAGRLDILLQDADATTRYEVEIQLGRTDESHIIRTIEYWDIERKRYPQYDHVAVIIAEEITSRFLNVISIFNGFIPLMAIQMSALRKGSDVGLIFTTVLDRVSLGLVDEDDEIYEPADRSYWENRATKKTVSMADQLLEIARIFDPLLELKYNKFYIGLVRDGIPRNFIIFRPKKDFIRFEPKLKSSTEAREILEKSGLDIMDYDYRWGRYRIRLQQADIENNKEVLTQIIKMAYEEFGTD